MVRLVDFEEFVGHLRLLDAFEDLDQWTITEETLGRTSSHKYRFRRGDKDYFVKEIKENERDILKLLVPLALTHVVKVAYPDLLDDSILVTPFIAGGPIKGRDLEPGLIRDFATIQNYFNSPEFLVEPGTEGGVFFERYLVRCLEIGYRNLLGFRTRNLHIVEQHISIAEHLLPNQNQLAEEFSYMPFARQHHDFREGNILGANPQVIIDWGSSYGRGPFLYDLAPFLFSHERNLEVFIEHSDICKQADRETIDRWLYVATSARFFSL